MVDMAILKQLDDLDEHENRGKGFTLLELLVVISIVSLLLTISVPALRQAQRQAKTLCNINKQKDSVQGTTLFAFDNNDRFPDSVATIAQGPGWNWSDPRVLIAKEATFLGQHRAISEYLYDYIPDASTMYCANSPSKYRYLQDAWDAGDDWDNPDNLFPQDPMTGSLCVYWNYVGYLGDSQLFYGPKRFSGGSRASKILVSDYFGYDHYRARNAYGSCESFPRTSTTSSKLLSADFWFRDYEGFGDIPEIKLHAGYVDGHVEEYGSKEVVGMKVIIDPETNEPYADGVGPGIFFIPKSSLR